MPKSYDDVSLNGTLTAGSVVVYTVPAGRKFIPAGFVISNGDSVDRKAEVLWDGKRIMPFVQAIPTGDVAQGQSPLPVLTAGKTVAMKGEVITAMDWFLWGQEEY